MYCGKLIGTVVLQNTSPQALPNTQQILALKSYFKNANTTNIVYEKLIERGEKSTVIVLSAVIRVLKNNLWYFPPSLPVLHTLSAFCQSTLKNIDSRQQEEFDTEALRKSIAFVECLVHRLMKIEQPPGFQIYNLPNQSENSSRDGKTKKHKKEKTSQQMTIHQKIILHSFRTFRLPQTYSVNTIDRWRFYPHVEEIPPPPTTLKIPYNEDMKHIKTVCVAKKSEDKLNYQSFRRPLTLFRYKYYQEQSRLNANSQIIDDLINTMIKPDDNNQETQLNASKVLIKIFLDLFCTDLDYAGHLITNVVMEMLEYHKSSTTAHAFNLIFNLSVHVNLVEEISLMKGEGMSPTMQTIHTIIYNIVLEMLLYLVHQKEKKRKVWFSAMNLLFYLILDNGEIDRNKLSSLDIRVLPCFLKYIDYLSEPVYRQLISMLVNRLYEFDLKTLNLKLLDLCGGISFILDLFVRKVSQESMENLFVVIFDYIILRFGDFSNFPSKVIELLLELFYSPGVLDGLRHSFKCFPEVIPCTNVNNVKEDTILSFVKPCRYLVQYLNFQNSPSHMRSLNNLNLPKTKSYTHKNRISPREKNLKSFTHSSSIDTRQSQENDKIPEKKLILPKAKLLQVLNWFYILAAEYNKIEMELTSIYAEMLSGMLEENSISTLNELLTSTIDIERRNGLQLLFALKKSIFFSPQKYKFLFLSMLEKVFVGLVLHSSPIVRRGYIILTERLALYLRYHESTKNREDLEFLNTYLMKCTASEKNEQNLVLITEVLFEFIFKNLDNAQSGDLVIQQILEGNLIIEYNIVKMIEITLLKYLFVHIPPRYTSYIRLVLIYIIIFRCKQSKQDLELIGGISFFKKLLYENDPSTSFLASRFLMDILQKEKPGEFSQIISALLDQAVTLNDEKLISNPYLQIKAILDMKDVLGQ